MYVHPIVNSLDVFVYGMVNCVHLYMTIHIASCFDSATASCSVSYSKLSCYIPTTCTATKQFNLFTSVAKIIIFSNARKKFIIINTGTKLTFFLAASRVRSTVEHKCVGRPENVICSAGPQIDHPEGKAGYLFKVFAFEV